MWADTLGIKEHALQQWQAGMATVTHPVTHEQVVGGDAGGRHWLVEAARGVCVMCFGCDAKAL